MRQISYTPVHVFTAVWLLIAPALAAAGLVDLGTLGGNSSEAIAINAAGQIAGDSDVDATFNHQHAFLFSGGVMTDLGTFGGNASFSTAINASGQVVGYGDTASGKRHAFLYDGTMHDIDPIDGFDSEATDINDSGQVTIDVDFGDEFGSSVAFVYSGGTMTNLGSLGGTSTGTSDINNSGQIVGASRLFGDQSIHAFLYSAGVMTDLGTLGGNFSAAAAINESGVIVGTSTLVNGDSHAFVYQDGVMTDLGTFGGTYSEAVAVNDAGQVTGSAATKNNLATYAFIYHDGVMTNLGTVMEIGTSPRAINASGQLAGDTSSITLLHGFVYSHGAMSDLGTLGGVFNFPHDINDSGQVVGVASVSGNSASHAYRRDPECGDGIWDLAEGCDGDCCQSDCTYVGPAETCLVASKSSFSIKQSPKNKLSGMKWKWAGGAFSQADLGTPSSGTAYTLCINDSTAGVDRLVASMRIDPNAAWVSKDPKGWSYKDKTGAEAGVTSVKLSADDPGKVQLGAKGIYIPLLEPFSDSALVDQDPRVIVQLFNDSTPTCWSSEFTAASKNTPSDFKTKTP